MSAETPQQPPSEQPAPPPPPPSQTPPPPPAWQQRTPPPPPRRSSSGWKWGCGIALGGCLLLVALFILLIVIVIAAGQSTMGVQSSGSGEIALIRVEGMITSGGSSSSPFSGVSAGSDDIIRLINRAAADDSIKAIVLRVNSPGGSAAASQEIYDAVVRAKAKKKIVVSMADLAASGGYYISCPADAIYANAATATGSIGVIAQYMNYQGLMGKLGITSEDIKSGKMKDMFSPTTPLTPEARQVMQSIVMDIYGQFVEAVAKGRKGKLARAEVLKLADGRIYSGTQAKKLKLIDEIGGLHEALYGAAHLAGIKGEPTYREYSTPSLLRQLLGSDFGGRSRKSAVTVTGGILYDEQAALLIPGPWQTVPARLGEP